MEGTGGEKKSFGTEFFGISVGRGGASTRESVRVKEHTHTKTHPLPLEECNGGREEAGTTLQQSNLKR